MNKDKLRAEWWDFWCKECQHCEQTYLTADTHGIVLDFMVEKLSQSHQQGRMEMAQEIGAEIEKRATTHHKECLTDMFINGRFWEDKDLQEIINNLKTNTPTTEAER